MHNIKNILKINLKYITKCTLIRTNTSTAAAAAAISTKDILLSVPHPEGIQQQQQQPANPKLQTIVNDIAKLNLLEVSELSSLLKKTLNLPDAPAGMMMMGGGAGLNMGRSQADEDEEQTPKKVQTSFKVKLMKFDEKQKVPLIKEIKTLMEGMNLVQAKKFVESAPTTVKDDTTKDEAQKLKVALEKVGATIEIE